MHVSVELMTLSQMEMLGVGRVICKGTRGGVFLFVGYLVTIISCEFDYKF